MANTPRDKREALEKLGKLLDCAGTALSWETVERTLRRLPTTTINALAYRVDRARADAFERGQQDERGDSSAVTDGHVANA